MSGDSANFDIRIKFVPNTMNAPDVVRCFRCDFEFLPEVAHMIIDCSTGVKVEIFVPYKIHYHIISKHSMWIHDKKGKNIKLLCSEPNLCFAYADQSVF